MWKGFYYYDLHFIIMTKSAVVSFEAVISHEAKLTGTLEIEYDEPVSYAWIEEKAKEILCNSFEGVDILCICISDGEVC